MENSNKVPYDPGWNDPPLFSYDSHATQMNQEKRASLLKKRVAFPLQKDDSNNSVTPPQILNPAGIPPFSKPPLSSLLKPSTGEELSPSCASAEFKQSVCGFEEEEEDFKEEADLPSVLNNLSSALNNNSDNVDLQGKIPEIRRRIVMLEKLWTDGKLSTPMKQKILKLSEAISSCDVEKADHIQRGLMVDHAALCSSWMSGLRHLIHASSTLKQTPTPTTEIEDQR